MSGAPYIGSTISLVSKADVRYEGILYSIDLKDTTVTLAKVRMYGTEDRQTSKFIPPRTEIFEYIVFRATDIQSLNVCEPPATPPQQTPHQPPQDPAIIQSATVGSPGSFPYRPPYQSPGIFSPFGGLPYSNYAMGFQPATHQFPEPQMPSTPQMTGAPPIPNPTPPEAGLSRDSTPSPSSVTQMSQETQTKTTSQQSTQTTKKKTPRRNSIEKTQERENRKPEQADQEKNAENVPEQRKSTNENKQRGNNRRVQGRRGGYRGPRRDNTKPKEFEGEYDFESANAKFKKEEIEEELHKKLGHVLTISDEVEIEGEGENISTQNPESVNYYDKGNSFFDTISCEANDRGRNRSRGHWQQERKLNTETFGSSGVRRGRGGYRGRGYGLYRGSGGGRGYRGRGWRGGRGARGSNRNNSSRDWVDYPLDADSSKLQENLPSGTTSSSQTPVKA